jgi:septal ring factor EnvC (AmiA/AmiB activator)
VRNALCLLLLVLAWPVQAALDTKQDELKELRGRIDQLREELERTSEDHAEAADALKKSERQISTVKRTLRDLGHEERRLNRELARLETESRQVEAELRDQQARLGELLRQRYYQGGEDGLRLMLSGRPPSEIARHLHYYTYIGRARAELIAAQRDTLARLDSLKTETAQQKDKLSKVREDRQAQKQALEGVKHARETILTKLSTQIRQQRKEIKTLQQDEARLARLIERLRKLASTPKPPSGKPPRPGQSVDRVASAALAGIDFPKLKGRLALPVAGEIIARYGQAREGGGPSWKGLYIRTRTGQEVRAVASGQVVFADWLRGFGNLLIVDHGDGYLSLYSNNESLYKQPGDAVRAGDIVAAAGNTGGQEEPGLYFELRHQGKPFDPMQWVASK